MDDEETDEEYLRRHNIIELFKRLLTVLLVARPSEPLYFLINAVKMSQAPRVVIVGRPGSGVLIQTTFFSRKFGVSALRLPEIFGEAVQSGSHLGRHLKSLLQDDKPISDSVVVEVIARRVQKEDCRQRGWVLEDYPQTPSQTRELQVQGLLPCLAFFLDVDKEVALQRLRMRREAAAISPTSSNLELVERRHIALESPQTVMDWEYVRAFSGELRHVLVKIDANKPANEVFGEIVSHTVSRICAGNDISHGSTRCILLGPRGSGARSQALRLAAKLNLAYISALELSDESTSTRVQLDEMSMEEHRRVAKLVCTRISEMAVLGSGWVLHGFPNVVEQAKELFLSSSTYPSKVIWLEVPEATRLERIVHRRRDPESGRYYPLTCPPLSQSILSRLVQDSEDCKESVEKSTKFFSALQPALREEFRGLWIEVGADIPQDEVTRKLALELTFKNQH